MASVVNRTSVSVVKKVGQDDDGKDVSKRHAIAGVANEATDSQILAVASAVSPLFAGTLLNVEKTVVSTIEG